MPVKYSPDPEVRKPSSVALGLAVGAIGVVFGDIGTSPLYTLKEVFRGTHAVAPDTPNVLGILSLVFWSLIVVVSLKYVTVIMRADNRGEGGIMALIALSQRIATASPQTRWLLMSLGLFGAALFYGDGLITPAISVLSAVEGLQVAAPGLEPYVEPIALAVLAALFALQSRGTGQVGRLFGPIMVVWFCVLATLGALSILEHPSVLAALNPQYAVAFFSAHGMHGVLVLGSVVLAITGAEALYADMGHFGRSPIRSAWFLFVLPALLLNYFGQGALLLYEPKSVQNPFYHMAPEWALYPMIALATAATVIASQAVISGAFSVTRQAVQLGYAPRLLIRHTSETEAGQIYVPFVNWMMLIGVAFLVLGFDSSSNLAAAYGIAVTGTFAIDTLLVFAVMRGLWGLGWPATLLGAAGFLAVDLSFFGANSLKIPDGGWFPLVVAVVIFTLLSTWKQGRRLLAERLQSGAIPVEPFLQSLAQALPTRVPGAAVFMTTQPTGVPHAILHNLKHNKVLHQHVVLLTVQGADVPHVASGERMHYEDLTQGFHRVLLRYGFQDDVDIPKAMSECPCMPFDLMTTTFFFSRETIVPSRLAGMSRWRKVVFAAMSRSAASPMSFFRIPANRVVELGTQVEL